MRTRGTGRIFIQFCLTLLGIYLFTDVLSRMTACGVAPVAWCDGYEERKKQRDEKSKGESRKKKKSDWRVAEKERMRRQQTTKRDKALNHKLP